MKTSQQSVRVGLFFLLGVALIWVTYETLSGSKVFKANGYTLIAGFPSLQDLKVTDEVRMAGVLIGAVSETRLANNRAEAVLRIDPKVKVPSDATATVASAGIIGTDYVSIDLGTPGAPPLAPGSEIHTRVTPDISTIMTELGDLGQKLDGALKTINTAFGGDEKGGGLFQKLNSLVGDNQVKINETVSNLHDITGKLDRGEGTLGKLINDPQLHDQLLAAVGEFRATAGQAKEFIANAQGIVAQVKAGQGALGVLVYDPQSAQDLKQAFSDVRIVSDKLANGQGTLGRLISDDSLYFGVQGTLKKADRAMDSLNDSGPMTAVGILANALF
ncbi:MAG: MlaD family protein [Opitutaceae bacterium]|jgi:phospholipid/cholesterol/gamma-HCH transport system substrate-binding protein